MHSSGPLWPVCGPIPANGAGQAATGISYRFADLRFRGGAGEGNRTLMTSLEGR